MEQSEYLEHFKILLSNISCLSFFLKWNIVYYQIDGLKYEDTRTDNATEENLRNLVHIANDLLKRPVSSVNFETGFYEPISDKRKPVGKADWTNEMALVE